MKTKRKKKKKKKKRTRVRTPVFDGVVGKSLILEQRVSDDLF